MKSKILSLSKSEDFKNLLKGRKITNTYSTIFFKKISSKNNKLLNVSFVTKRKIGTLPAFPSHSEAAVEVCSFPQWPFDRDDAGTQQVTEFCQRIP